MHSDTRARVERGLRIVPALEDIVPGRASRRVQAVFSDLEATLRVPFVNYVFRLLANWPDYFEGVWALMAPGVGSFAFERVADELRSQAVLPASHMDIGESLHPADLATISAFTDTIHYVLPKLVLFATCIDLELVLPGDRSSADCDRFPRGAAQGTMALPMLPLDEASETVQPIFDEIRTTHGHPGVASYYRGIAYWPKFLAAVWGGIRPRINSEAYRRRRQELLHLARALVEERLNPRPFRAMADFVPPDGAASVAAVFRYRMTVDLLLDVSLIQQMLHGYERARNSRFSIAEPDSR